MVARLSFFLTIVKDFAKLTPFVDISKYSIFFYILLFYSTPSTETSHDKGRAQEKRKAAVTTRITAAYDMERRHYLTADGPI